MKESPCAGHEYGKCPHCAAPTCPVKKKRSARQPRYTGMQAIRDADRRAERREAIANAKRRWNAKLYKELIELRECVEDGWMNSVRERIARLTGTAAAGMALRRHK